jgi:hypothetical protein
VLGFLGGGSGHAGSHLAQRMMGLSRAAGELRTHARAAHAQRSRFLCFSNAQLST